MLYLLITRNPNKDISLHVSANNSAMVSPSPHHPPADRPLTRTTPTAIVQPIWVQSGRVRRRVLRRLPGSRIPCIQECLQTAVAAMINLSRSDGNMSSLNREREWGGSKIVHVSRCRHENSATPERFIIVSRSFKLGEGRGSSLSDLPAAACYSITLEHLRSRLCAKRSKDESSWHPGLPSLDTGIVHSLS